MFEEEQTINARRFLRDIDYIYSFSRRIFYIQRCNYMHICICMYARAHARACVWLRAYTDISYVCMSVVHVYLTYIITNSKWMVRLNGRTWK